MNVPKILQLVREQCFVDTIQVPDTILLDYVNIAYHDIEQKLVTFINEHLFYERQTTNLIAGINEYPLPTGSSNISSSTYIPPANTGNPVVTDDIRKLLTISVKLDPQHTFYTRCKETNQSNLDKDLETYRKLQSKCVPLFIIQGHSIFIYPEPEIDITNGLKFEAIRKLADLTIATPENEIGIPRDYHKLIIKGTKPRVFDQRGKHEEKQRADIDYKNSLSEMISEMTDLIAVPVEKGYYNSNKYFY